MTDNLKSAERHCDLPKAKGIVDAFWVKLLSVAATDVPRQDGQRVCGHSKSVSDTFRLIFSNGGRRLSFFGLRPMVAKKEVRVFLALSGNAPDEVDGSTFRGYRKSPLTVREVDSTWVLPLP